MTKLKAFNFQNWIDEHRHLLKPPVGNKVIFKDSTLIAMVVGGPNSRTDFHINQTDEFFYQLEGQAFLRIINEEGKVDKVELNAGDIFMLPAGVPHSPQRLPDSVGLVVEHTRTEGTKDALLWYCANCESKLYQEWFHLTNIETDFGAVYDRYFNSDAPTCKKCGHVNGKEWNPPGDK